MTEGSGAKNCRVCCEPMPGAARKCLRCNSVQGWGRFAAVSATTLALLTALVTVTEQAAPTFISLWRGSYSKLAVTPLDTNDNALRLMVVNSGTSAGALQENTFSLRAADGSIDVPLAVDPTLGLIKPGEARELKLVLREGEMPKMISILSEDDPNAVDANGRRWLRVFPTYRAQVVGQARNYDGSTESFSWPVGLSCNLNSCGFELTQSDQQSRVSPPRPASAPIRQ